MKKKGIGIFGKMYFYTIFFILALIFITSAVFRRQIEEFYVVSKHQSVKETFLDFQEFVYGKSYDEIEIIAEQFNNENPLYEFALYDAYGVLVYTTPLCSNILEPDTEGWNIADDPLHDLSLANFSPSGDKLGLLAFYPDFSPPFIDFFKMFAFSLIAVLAISLIGAAVFAKLITDPVKRLADDAQRMSLLEPMPSPPPPPQRDEIGQLREDIHKMYQKLKTLICDLEQEILRRKSIEEGQRYFFLAASHELKTPIAAVNALLEGMLEDVGDYQNHPKYIAECLKLTNMQTKLIKDILEIVRLNDNDRKPSYERINLKTVIMELMSPYEAITERKCQNLEIDIPDSVFCTVDKNMFIRAFCNVLMNAIENSKEGKSIKIWCGAEKSIRLSILNTGANVEENMLEKLFEPFYRADGARSRKDGHSGMGLAIVKKLLDGMDIPFGILNTENGVLFWMELL